MRIVSINIGQVSEHSYFDKPVITGGHKRPVGAATLRTTHFEGDEQADLKNHGGPDKAVCVYAFDHYPYWENALGEKLAPGAFSENLTLAGALETEVCLGDEWAIGTAVVQVSQPRQPCNKLAGRHQRRDLGDLIHANSYSGFYVRVVRAGEVQTGEAITIVQRHPAAVTIEFANRVMYKQLTDEASLRRVLDVPELSASWRATLERRLRPRA